MICRRALLTLFVLPVALAAQSPSASLGWWTTTGGKDGNAAASGLRVAGQLGARLASRELRFEAAFSQAIFHRAFVSGETRVNENSLEVAPLLPLTTGGTTWWPFAGPIVSLGLGCATDSHNDPNGKASCTSDGSPSHGSVRLGAAVGFAISRPMGSALFTAEARLQANTVAAARGTGPAILVAVGIRLP